MVLYLSVHHHHPQPPASFLFGALNTTDKRFPRNPFFVLFFLFSIHYGIPFPRLPLESLQYSTTDSPHNSHLAPLKALKALKATIQSSDCGVFPKHRPSQPGGARRAIDEREVMGSLPAQVGSLAHARYLPARALSFQQSRLPLSTHTPRVRST